MYDEFRLVANIYLHGWGTGIVGEVSSISTDTVTLKDDVLPISYFYPNQVIDGGSSDSSASPNHDTGLIVKTVDKVLKKVQFTTTPSTVAANDYLFIGGSAQVAPLGLFAAVDDSTYVTTYVNVSRSTTPDFKSYVDAQGGTATKYGNATRRTITPNLLQVVLDEQQLRAGVQRPVDLLYSSLKVRRVFWQGLAPDRRYDSGTYDGGWKAIKFSNGDVEMPWVASEFAPRYTIFGLYTGTNPQPQGHKSDKIADEEVLALYESPWGAAEWDDASGGQLKQVYSSGAFVDAVGAYLKWYFQFA